MPNAPTSPSHSKLNPASQMAFSVAVCALAVAGIGSIVNHWLTGWMAVGGMVGVALFYLAVGVLNLNGKHLVFDDDESMSNASQRTARADNLFAEGVSRPRVGIQIPSELPERVGINIDD